jgi:holo-[acyl-carrier protein] synthase
MEIGIDCVDIARFKGSMLIEGFKNKVFTENEISYCESKANPIEHYAVRFAGKEAVMKALALEKMGMHQIEILDDEKGRPFVNILGSNLKPKKREMKISLSHSDTVAVALFVVIS